MLLNFQILDSQAQDPKDSLPMVIFLLMKDNYVPGPGNYQ